MSRSMQRVGSRIYMIDSGFLGLPKLAAVYYIDAPRPALIETSGSLVAREVIETLKSAGVDALAYVIVSHIHLDHAGGAGHFLKEYPGAKLVVHPEGARHMADPERLHRSAERVYGKQAMIKEWGYLEPVPKDAIVPAADGQSLDLGDGALRILFTPGHAKHHICVFDLSEGALFLGDSAGVYLCDVEYQTLSAPPPDLDPYLACESLERVAELVPEVILFTHYGPGNETERLLENARRQYMEWLRVVEDGFYRSQNTEEIAERLAKEADPERSRLPQDAVARLAKLVPYDVQVEGYIGYLRRRTEKKRRNNGI
ncbi:MAG: MBL fold metallo-hydrolase [Acidimicrobiia bacterium]